MAQEHQPAAASTANPDWEGLRRDLAALGYWKFQTLTFLGLKGVLLEHLEMRERGGGEHRGKLVSER